MKSGYVGRCTGYDENGYQNLDYVLGGAVPPADPYLDLTHYWNLNEAVFGPWVDSVDAVNMALGFGGGHTSVAGKLGQAVNTNGGSIVAGGIPANVPHSMAMWVKPPATIGTLDLLVWGSATLRYVGASDTLRLIGTGTTNGTAVLVDGVWHHVVATYAAGVVRVYVNGVLDITQSHTQGAGTGPELWSVAFDESGWFSTELSLARVQALYNGGAGVFYP